MFETFTPELVKIERSLVEFALLAVVTFDPVLQLPVNEFHEYGLRAYPSAKYPSVNNCEQYNEYYEGYHRQHKQVKILRVKHYPENDKFPFDDIEKNQGIAFNFYKRNNDENNQKNS